MRGQALSPELLSRVAAILLAAILLSLGFSYIPGLAGWFDRLKELNMTLQEKI